MAEVYVGVEMTLGRVELENREREGDTFQARKNPEQDHFMGHGFRALKATDLEPGLRVWK